MPPEHKSRWKGRAPEGTEGGEIAGDEANTDFDSLPVKKYKVDPLQELARDALDGGGTGLEIGKLDGVKILGNGVVETGHKGKSSYQEGAD